ncbi:MAG: hypothetical protein V7L26_26955 [Nostoc sp.]|uniref:hypothetical protein n=1 Tax=Nostoc sp. TaxID=1180 RepID=UPI002FF5185A
MRKTPSQYCSDKQGKQGRQNSTPASISPPAIEQLASIKKFQNLRSIEPRPLVGGEVFKDVTRRQLQQKGTRSAKRRMNAMSGRNRLNKTGLVRLERTT